jgi:hypothetical protein
MSGPDRLQGLLRGWPALAAAVLLLPAPASTGPAAQPPDVRAALAPDTVAALLVRTLERSPATAVALAFPAGSGNDPEGASGAASLLARTLEERIRGALPAGSALVSSRVERDLVAFSLVTPPDDWSTAWEALARVLFREPLPAEAVEGARQEILGPLRFERGAPVRLFELEADRMVLGTAHPWARPVQGVETEVAGIPAEQIEALRLRWIRPEDARVVVMGPVDREGLRPWLSVHGETPPAPPTIPDSIPADSTGAVVDPETAAPREVEPTTPATAAPSPPAQRAWTTGERVTLEREVVNAWVTVAWPAPTDLSRTHLAFAAHVARELLTPVPADPGLFSVTTRVEETPGGPVLRVVAAVLPGQASRWEERILSTIPGLADSPPPDEFLAVYRRRFAGEMLLPLSLPEEGALRSAAELVRGTGPVDLEDEIHALGAEELVSAIRLLGVPRILLFGPS